MPNVILNFSQYYVPSKECQKSFIQKKIKFYSFKSNRQFHPQKQVIKILEKFSHIKGIVYGDDEISKDVIKVLKQKKTKFIIKWGQGLDSIDLVAAKKNKIKVINFPGIFKNEVAELAIGFILNLLRKINVLDQNTKQLKWHRIFSHNLKKKKVGIIGFGNIGKEIAKKLKGFDVSILYNDPKVNTDHFTKTNIKTIFQKSNIIILACDLNHSNYGFINNSVLKYSKQKPYLINIARGKLVNETHIANYIAKKKISGYATDVFESEPILKRNPLLKYKKNTLFTNHSASVTYEAVQHINREISKNIIKFI